jgi:hypothetical protein
MDTGKFGAVTKALVGRLSRRAALRRAGATAALPTLALLGHAVPARARQATPVTGAAEGVDPGWYAAIRRSRFREGVSSQDVARVVHEGFLPIVTEVPGFVAYYVVDDAQGGHVTVSVFADPAGPAESSRRSAAWVPGALGGLVEGPAAVLAEGEVQVFAVAEPAASCA